jgi:hypothetical protein
MDDDVRALKAKIQDTIEALAEAICDGRDGAHLARVLDRLARLLATIETRNGKRR